MNNKFFKRIVVFIFIIVLFICIGLTNGKNRKVNIIETFVSDLVSGPQRLFTHFKNWVIKDKEFFSDIQELEEENKKLKEENSKLQKKVIDYEVISSENKVLKEHSKTMEMYPNYNVIVAEIILDAVNNWEEVYVIDKGSKDGIKENMAVITTDGLVGYIMSVSDNTSKVVSILDAGSSVSSRVTKTRDAVMCKGSNSLKENGQVRLTYIPIGVELIEGDKIETSGMGGIYPKGIAIGRVKNFITKKNPTENEAIVETYVDFNKLETVAVIIEEL